MIIKIWFYNGSHIYVIQRRNFYFCQIWKKKQYVLGLQTQYLFCLLFSLKLNDFIVYFFKWLSLLANKMFIFSEMSQLTRNPLNTLKNWFHLPASPVKLMQPYLLTSFSRFSSVSNFFKGVLGYYWFFN